MIKTQKNICDQFGADYIASDDEMKVGIALNTIDKKPINGLRHPIEKDTCGWYIWGGEEFSDSSDFFQPLHVKHLKNYVPDIIPYLGLPPGYRLLLDGEHVDVWFDEKLMKL
jgi:hypothetical protein